MNKAHRSLWNSSLGAWVAAPETARASGKSGAGSTVRTVLLAAGLTVSGAAVLA
ncbi:ESPR domain-containing protein, partial [Acidovorax cavernicola]